MSKAEDLSKQYVLPFLDKQYEKYGEHKQMKLSKFDGYDMMSAYEEGYHQAEKDLHKSIYKAGVLDGFEDAVEGQYEKGYKQAEKDMELTWEDMALVCKIEFLICTEYKGGKLPQRELFYQEILKRFKDFRERKEK